MEVRGGWGGGGIGADTHNIRGKRLPERGAGVEVILVTCELNIQEEKEGEEGRPIEADGHNIPEEMRLFEVREVEGRWAYYGIKKEKRCEVDNEIDINR